MSHMVYEQLLHKEQQLATGRYSKPLDLDTEGILNEAMIS